MSASLAMLIESDALTRTTKPKQSYRYASPRRVTLNCYRTSPDIILRALATSLSAHKTVSVSNGRSRFGNWRFRVHLL